MDTGGIRMFLLIFLCFQWCIRHSGNGAVTLVPAGDFRSLAQVHLPSADFCCPGLVVTDFQLSHPHFSSSTIQSSTTSSQHSVPCMGQLWFCAKALCNIETDKQGCLGMGLRRFLIAQCFAAMAPYEFVTVLPVKSRIS